MNKLRYLIFFFLFGLMWSANAYPNYSSTAPTETPQISPYTSGTPSSSTTAGGTGGGSSGVCYGIYCGTPEQVKAAQDQIDAYNKANHGPLFVFTLGATIAGLFDKSLTAIKTSISNAMGSKGDVVLNLFIALFIIETAYTLVSNFVEQKFESIVSTLMVRCFTGVLVYTLLDGFIIMDIISEITSKIMTLPSSAPAQYGSFEPLSSWFKDGQTSNALFAVTKPLTVADNLLNIVSNQINDLKAGTLDLVGHFSIAFTQLILYIVLFICSWIIYIIAAKLALGLLLKTVEWSIGVSASLIGLAGYGSELTKQHAETSMGYLIAVAIDYTCTVFMFSIALAVLDAGTAMSTGNSDTFSQGINILLGMVMSFILFAALNNIGPEIAAGINAGAPNVTQAHAGALASAAGTFGSAVGGVAKGGAMMAGGAALGGASGMLKGFKAGVATNGSIKQGIMGGLGGLAKGGLKGGGSQLAKAAGNIGQTIATSHAGHQMDHRNTGLKNVMENLLKTVSGKTDKQLHSKEVKADNKAHAKKTSLLNSKRTKASKAISKAKQNFVNNKGSSSKIQEAIQKHQEAEQAFTEHVNNPPVNENHTLDGKKPTISLANLPKKPTNKQIMSMSSKDIEKYYKSRAKK